MKTLTFYNLEEMNDYYDESTNTFRFFGNDGLACNVVIRFDLEIDAGILCHNLDCIDIHVESISAWDIEACTINTNTIIAHDIDATNVKADEIVLTNGGHLSVMGIIRCLDIYSERLKNW